MESKELRTIWNTLANQQLIDKELARENIRRIIENQGKGILEKLSRKVKREIVIDWIALGLVVAIAIGTFILQFHFPVEKKAHMVLLVVIGYFAFKLYRDKRKYQLLQMPDPNSSIRENALAGQSLLKQLFRQDMILGISFLIVLNLYVITIYFRAFGNWQTIDFSGFNMQSIGFAILVLLVLFVVVAPWVMKWYFRKHYQLVIEEFEGILNELQEEFDTADI